MLPYGNVKDFQPWDASRNLQFQIRLKRTGLVHVKVFWDWQKSEHEWMNMKSVNFRECKRSRLAARGLPVWISQPAGKSYGNKWLLLFPPSTTIKKSTEQGTKAQCAPAELLSGMGGIKCDYPWPGNFHCSLCITLQQPGFRSLTCNVRTNNQRVDCLCAHIWGDIGVDFWSDYWPYRIRLDSDVSRQARLRGSSEATDKMWIITDHYGAFWWLSGLGHLLWKHDLCHVFPISHPNL